MLKVADFFWFCSLEFLFVDIVVVAADGRSWCYYTSTNQQQ
jgi:predicted GNAT superfamily acetyltransferase